MSTKTLLNVYFLREPSQVVLLVAVGPTHTRTLPLVCSVLQVALITLMCCMSVVLTLTYSVCAILAMLLLRTVVSNVVLAPILQALAVISVGVVHIHLLLA